MSTLHDIWGIFCVLLRFPPHKLLYDFALKLQWENEFPNEAKWARFVSVER